MPIFSTQLGKVEEMTSVDAVHRIADHIRIIQEQLEYRLSFLDSSNISEIDTGITNVLTEGKNINNILKDQDGNMSQLRQDADNILLRVQNSEGDLSQLLIRADLIESAVKNAEGDISQIRQQADQITLTVQNQAGDITQLKQRADSVESTVNGHTGDISQIRQTAESISSTVSSNTGDISQLKQTANSLTSTIESHTGDISQLKQTATSLTSTVESFDGRISQIKQTSDAISLTVENMEAGLGNTLRVAADGVTITNASGSKLTIDGGQIKANTLTLTGYIKFTDFSSDMQLSYNQVASQASTAGAAHSMASSAITGLQAVANGTYSGGTFINGTSIYSPDLYGDTINLLDGYSRQVGSISLKYSESYAFDITSALSLRLKAGSSYNAFMGVDSGPYVMCQSVAQAGVAQVQIGGGVLVLTDTNFGVSLPYAGTYGQIYFAFS